MRRIGAVRTFLPAMAAGDRPQEPSGQACGAIAAGGRPVAGGNEGLLSSRTPAEWGEEGDCWERQRAAGVIDRLGRVKFGRKGIC